MADYSTQGGISPCIPNHPRVRAQMYLTLSLPKNWESFLNSIAEFDPHPWVRLWKKGIAPGVSTKEEAQTAVDRLEILALATAHGDIDCGGTWTEEWESVLLSMESYADVQGMSSLFCEEGIPEGLTAFLQWILRHPELFPTGMKPPVAYGGEFATTCSKNRASGFGGQAVYVTRSRVRWFSTIDWLEDAYKGPYVEVPLPPKTRALPAWKAGK